jgi:DNA adenine methylase
MSQCSPIPSRPILRYRGGKFRLADWVISHFPAHRVYVEPYGGAASVLMRKSRSYAEIYNDLDQEVVNVFTVLRDPMTALELERRLRLTPYARAEYFDAYLEHSNLDDSVERARRTIVKSFMGFSSGAIHDNKPKGMRTSASMWRPSGFVGFRLAEGRSGTTPAHDWSNFPDQLRMFTARLQGVVVENRPATGVLATYDSADTLAYVDPPYIHSTRNIRVSSGQYQHEMTDDDHRKLAEALRAFTGMVIVSGYPCPLYDELYSDWQCVTRATYADRARPRTECLWLSPRTVERLSTPLFQHHHNGGEA